MAADWTEFAVSGVSETTPQNIMLGAGTLYKNFTYEKAQNKWKGTILGATSGGNKLTIKPETTDIPVDGVTVKAKGLVQKIGTPFFQMVAMPPCLLLAGCTYPPTYTSLPSE